MNYLGLMDHTFLHHLYKQLNNAWVNLSFEFQHWFLFHLIEKCLNLGPQHLRDQLEMHQKNF